MGKSNKIPLVSGLIGRGSRSINGQLEVSLINYDTVHIAIWRKAYCGLPDITFSVPDADLQDVIDILNEAKKKTDTYWLSKAAAETKSKKGEDKKNAFNDEITCTNK